MDVDGTLTDGRIYMGNNGEVMKSFDVKDGYGIKNLLPSAGIIPVIISGRKSKIVRVRANELGIQYVLQGVNDKEKAICTLREKLHLTLEETAVIGDDLNDLPLMRQARLTGCPSNAVRMVKEQSGYICHNKGGEGAVREFIEWLCKQQTE